MASPVTSSPEAELSLLLQGVLLKTRVYTRVCCGAKTGKNGVESCILVLKFPWAPTAWHCSRLLWMRSWLTLLVCAWFWAWEDTCLICAKKERDSLLSFGSPIFPWVLIVWRYHAFFGCGSVSLGAWMVLRTLPQLDSFLEGNNPASSLAEEWKETAAHQRNTNSLIILHGKVCSFVLPCDKVRSLYFNTTKKVDLYTLPREKVCGFVLHNRTSPFLCSFVLSFPTPFLKISSVLPACSCVSSSCGVSNKSSFSLWSKDYSLFNFFFFFFWKPICFSWEPNTESSKVFAHSHKCSFLLFWHLRKIYFVCINSNCFQNFKQFIVATVFQHTQHSLPHVDSFRFKFMASSSFSFESSGQWRFHPGSAQIPYLADRLCFFQAI